MESSSVNGMCRCCASEGAFKDIKSSYHWMGEEEVYGDMLRECFDVNLSSAEHGGICELCITQLRNAANFKKQVLHTESQFKQHLRTKGLKSTPVKEEISVFDDNDSDDNDMDNVDDEDYVPDFEVPIKTESDSEEKPKKRGAKAATTRSKKSKSNDGDATVKSVRYSNVQIKVETISDTEVSGTDDVSSLFVSIKNENRSNRNIATPKHKETINIDGTESKRASSEIELSNSSTRVNSRAELRKHLHNLEIILVNSNATPVKSHNGIGYVCCFCALYYPEPQELKKHTLEKHSQLTQKERFACFLKHKTMREFCVMLDITNLQCLICREGIKTFDVLLTHLKTDHEQKMIADIKNHILPFMFNNGACECVICLKRYESFNLMRLHMNLHYNNFVCELCSASFVTQRQYANHVVQRHGASDGAKVQCSLCSKVFDTEHKKRCHEKSVHVHAHKRSKCALCGEKFRCDSKLKHMETVHGVEPPVLKCNACDRTFKTKIALRIHTRRDHLMERPHKCNQCEKSFYQSHLLDNHMLKHTGKKEFQCQVCLKSYGRKFTLQQHMRIHLNDRKFKCDRCGMAFVHKCSWKTHMRSTHGEVVQ